jgi:beta-glucanase (GH16 family)
MRGVVNIGCLFLLLLGLLILFAGYPVISHFTEKQLTTNGAYNVGGMNATGQVPFIPGFPKPVDDDTPDDVKTWTSAKSQKEYTLTFSDEFNKEGRTFFPGDDPYWQAV